MPMDQVIQVAGALLILAAVAAVFLILGIAPVETSTAMPHCPPSC